ncbi:MAG: hypothetical protein M0C28_46365 [Candidatus Moduliflexus flocculans]|nr:hypothetical protein [Candidatus Moduliflexus flocculans]
MAAARGRGVPAAGHPGRGRPGRRQGQPATRPSPPRSWPRRSLDRAKTLHQRGILSDAELDAAQSAFAARDARAKVTEAQLANQQAALETARVRLSYTRIRAAWEPGATSATSGSASSTPGRMLSSNTAILSVIELQPITAVIHVTEKDYFRLQARARPSP